MQRMVAFIGTWALVLAFNAAAFADKYHVTPAEKAACTEDAVRLCISAYPNEEKLIACMKANHDSLSATCQVAFDAGLRRRHL
jgi:hypothetical protein